jgi:transcriptional regulator with XRE-family HTH domain
MDQQHLKQVQAAGWQIEAVQPDHVIARCPSVGCALRAKLALGGPVPAVDPARARSRVEARIQSYDDLRQQLRERREALLLSIREIEEIAGLTVDHLAKLEHDGRTRLPDIQTIMDWCGAVGYEIVLRPVPMTALALRTICDTRDRVDARAKRMSIEARRRATKAS